MLTSGTVTVRPREDTIGVIGTNAFSLGVYRLNQSKNHSGRPLVDQSVSLTLKVLNRRNATDALLGFCSKRGPHLDHFKPVADRACRGTTDPYHPLFQQEFELVIYRQNWGEERVWFHDATGRLISLPVVWTNVVAEDAFVAVSRGRSRLRVAELLELARLIEELKGLKQRGGV